MRRLIWLSILLLLAFFRPVFAQETLEQRLDSDRVGYIEPGAYLAGDDVQFALFSAGSNYLLRFDGCPETFVLYQGRAPLGGRVLKYDSGETALRVSGWGGVTLYTHSVPQGLPAERTGDKALQQLSPVSIGDLQSASTDEGQHLFYARRLNVVFTTKWNDLLRDAVARIFALDTLENVARGIEQFAQSQQGRAAFQRRVQRVSLLMAAPPSVALSGKTLVVDFDPKQGFAGRPSSRAITQSLARLLSAKPD